jgi:hypothetical protein
VVPTRASLHNFPYPCTERGAYIYGANGGGRLTSAFIWVRTLTSGIPEGFTPFCWGGVSNGYSKGAAHAQQYFQEEEEVSVLQSQVDVFFTVVVHHKKKQCVGLCSYSELSKTGQLAGHSSCFFIALQLAESATQCLALANAAKL